MKSVRGLNWIRLKRRKGYETYTGAKEEIIMDNIEKIAYEHYKKGGQTAVYNYADSLPFDLPDIYCVPCDDMTPYYNGACLVCGTYHPKV